MKIYIPPQVKRLLLLMTIFIVVFILIRAVLVPEGFGDYGHYRAGSLQDNESYEIKYAGHEACIECHSDIFELKEADLHSELNCEICHGPAQSHVEYPDSVDVKLNRERDFCALCHAAHAAKSTNVIFQINPDEHYIEKICIDCHNPHQPWELKE
ncbi:MAG: hypothetical protein ISS19_00810 [Bacteroidales bacterium]|nr:hypothetical protein [Bacteroidales bacterium]